jgi:hypothetical protein
MTVIDESSRAKPGKGPSHKSSVRRPTPKFASSRKTDSHCRTEKRRLKVLFVRCEAQTTAPASPEAREFLGSPFDCCDEFQKERTAVSEESPGFDPTFPDAFDPLPDAVIFQVPPRAVKTTFQHSTGVLDDPSFAPSEEEDNVNPSFLQLHVNDEH